MPKMSNMKHESGVHFRKSNVENVRKWIDVSSILDLLEIKVHRNGNELLARCPNKNHEDRTPSWGIHDERGTALNGIFHCHSCKWSGDIFKLIMEIKNCSFPEALKIASGERIVASVEADVEMSVDVGKLKVRSYWPVEIRLPKGVEEIKEVGSCRDYLESRDIFQSDIDRFGLMDWKWKRRIFVPLFFRGKMVSWLARTYVDDERKVLNQPGRGKTNWAMFGTNLFDTTKKIVNLTEGWVDAIRLHQAGFFNVTAVCGSTLTEEKIKQLTWAEKVRYWTDDDKAGKKFSKEVKNWFSKHAIVEVINLGDGRDPAECSIDELMQSTNQEKGE